MELLKKLFTRFIQSPTKTNAVNQNGSKLPPWPHAWNGKGVIVPAFEWKGTVYYTFTNADDLPAGRFEPMHILSVVQHARVDKDYGLELAARIQKIVGELSKLDNNSPQFKEKSGQITELLQDFKRRLAMNFDIISIMKAASVLYFDANESPYQYDAEYNKAKMLNWFQDKEHITAFFLLTPISALLKPLTGGESSLLPIIAGAITEARTQLENLLSSELETPMMNGNSTFLRSLKEALLK
jgi:hypothetical protein